MASTDQPSDRTPDAPVDATSDQVSANSCSSCGHRGRETEATQYCLDCKELLCQPCKESQQSFKQFRDHKCAPVASDRRILLDALVVNSSKANIRMSSDKRSPQVTGCAFLPDDQVVLCDQANVKIKLLAADNYKIVESLEFPSEAHHLAVVDSKTLIVALVEHKSLQYVAMDTTMKPGRVILLPKMPLAVEFVADEILVACKTPRKNGTGEILVLDKEGIVKRRLGVHADGSCMFDAPTDLAASHSTRNIFVSDRDRSSVTCLSPTGSVIYQCKSSELKRPRGVYVDAMDNLFVCDETTAHVLKLTSDGKLSGSLLTDKELNRPCSIAFREKDGTLLIGSYSSDKLLVVKIQ